MKSDAFAATSNAITNQGNVRDHNEDACLDAGDRGFWVVADGMGGHDFGDYASELIVERLGTIPELVRPSEFVNRVEDELLAVNRHLFDKSMEGEEPSVIGSTVVVLLAFERFCVSVWAGDSRIYRLRDGQLSRVTRDHSEVQNLVEQGLVKEEDAESHPQANVITRAVGGADSLFLDYRLDELAPDDRFLLCSDGLYKDITDAEIGDELTRGDCRETSESLLALALSRECNDNVTVLVVDFAATGVADASVAGTPGASEG
jgi:protein phosphatase